MATLLLAWCAASVVLPTALLVFALAAALHRRRRLARTPRATRPRSPGVDLVRPLCGREHDADAKNLSLLRQDYAPLTVTFVAQSGVDRGLTDARRCCGSDPRVTCVVGLDAAAASGKARNMIAGWRSSGAEIVAFCDSDIELSPGDVDRCVRAMLEQGASAAFAPCLFDASGWGRLAMHVATIDKLTLAEAGAALGLVPCLEGGLMLVSRAALESSGGIEVVADAVADDLRIGRVLKANGFRLAMSDAPILHTSPPEPARVWAQRYLRWAICRRTETPAAQLLALVFHPILVPSIVAMSGAGTVAWELLVGGALLRIAYAHASDRFLLAPRGVRLGAFCWARPLAEILDAAFMVAAFATRSLTWRGVSYDIDSRGRITRSMHLARPEAAALGTGLQG